jgi:hypothetical protein
MQRAFERQPTETTLRTRFAAAGSPLGPPPARRLPPTRAARPARSRGVFFGSHWRSGLGHWISNAAYIAVVTLTIAASAHFAQPTLDAVASTGNAGPELLASATRAASFLLAPGRSGIEPAQAEALNR